MSFSIHHKCLFFNILTSYSKALIYIKKRKVDIFFL
nr:MAG TPA_asm: hypothetical protein [Caudoviricetes sp.]